MSGNPRELLEQFDDRGSADPAAAREMTRNNLGHELITPEADNFAAYTRRADLPNLRIFRSVTSTPVSLVMESSKSTHVHMVQRGRCVVTTANRRAEACAGEAFVCTEGLPARIDYDADYEELVLSIPRSMLDRTFAALTAFPPKCAIEFSPVLDPGNPRYKGFRDLLLMLASKLDPALSLWPHATLEQLEVACVSALLFCGRHNLSHLLDHTPCADFPRHIRVAEHFAEVNADRDIGIDEMAQASGVSVSTLTRGFQKYRGCTPAAFIKRTRLARAKALLESRAASTVVAVALRCGFSNPSRFGRDYTQVFGETPTETLRRMRAQQLDA